MKDPGKLDFSVIIPAFNEEVLLPQTLSHLIECFSEIPQYAGEIIVVDNNSSDRTGEIARAVGQVRVVWEPVRSISKARNRGASEALGELLIFNDADSLVPLPTLRSALEAMAGTGCFGGGATIEFDANHGKFFFGKVVPSIWNFISSRFKLAAGSFLFCRASDFKSIGGFPEKIYAGEEIYFGMALKKKFRQSKEGMVIFTEYPVITSSRKLLWYGNLKMFSMLLIFLLFPFANRYKSLCRFWYNRPKRN